jgi:hypothetical protein
MKNIFGIGLTVILLIVVIFSNFTPTDQFPTKESLLDNSIGLAEEDFEIKFSYFKDANFGFSHTMVGKTVYYFIQEIKYGFIGAFYFAGAVEDAFPWIVENWVLVVAVILLITCTETVTILLFIILGLIIWIKDRVSKTKNKKSSGVWVNGIKK